MQLLTHFQSCCKSHLWFQTGTNPIRITENREKGSEIKEGQIGLY